MSVQTPHILIIANSSWYVRNFRAAFVESLVSAGYRVTVLASAEGHGDAEAIAPLEAMGAAHVALKMGYKSTNPLAEAGVLGRIWRHFRALRPDLIFSFTIKPNIYGGLAARALGIPFVPNVTGLGTVFSGESRLIHLIRPLYRRAFAATPVVFFQNDADMALFEAERLIAPGKARLLPGSGVNLTAFSESPMAEEETGPLRCFMAARLLKSKGVGLLAEAAARLKAQGIASQMRIAGRHDPADPDYVTEAEITAWSEAGHLTWLGSLPEVYPEMAAADCVVLPTSYPEGTPRSLLEALGVGRPVITTDRPGCRDVVEDGVTGFLIPEGDAAALTAALTRLSEMGPAGRAAMGRAARHRAETVFDEAFVTQAYHQVLAETLGSMRPEPAE